MWFETGLECKHCIWKSHSAPILKVLQFFFLLAAKHKEKGHGLADLGSDIADFRRPTARVDL
jgi:hypothetical protein